MLAIGQLLEYPQTPAHTAYLFQASLLRACERSLFSVGGHLASPR